jgi:2-methylcitrate dehydratase PrpD
MITEKLAHFVAETDTSDIPQQALIVAKSAITDYIGVTFPGSMEETGKIIAEYARRMGGEEESSVIGGGFKTSSYLASLANGTAGHALDYDDGGGFGHCSVVLAPAVLAIGESIGASGKDLLSAYVVGFEAVSTFHGMVGPAHYARGWHSTATTGSLAATAAVAWLLKLNSHQVRMALGITGSLLGGLRQNFGTMTKPLHAGNAASNGVKAAVLAKMGFTADENIIEAPGGASPMWIGLKRLINWVNLLVLSTMVRVRCILNSIHLVRQRILVLMRPWL